MTEPHIVYRAADLPALYPTDRAICTADAPTRYDLSQTVAALRAENRSLREQLRRQEDVLARYRVLDLDHDRALNPAHAAQWLPEPEDQA
jgi:hypothetical protein